MQNPEQCWEAFGDVGGVGLYPYNDTALRREVTKDGTALTPRTLVDRTVKAFLIEAEVPIADRNVSNGGDEGPLRLPSVTLKRRDRASGFGRRRRPRPAAQMPVIWADGGTEAHGVTVGFDLPVAAGPGRAPTPPPLTPGHVTAAPVPRPLDPLFAWQNGSGATRGRGGLVSGAPGDPRAQSHRPRRTPYRRQRWPGEAPIGQRASAGQLELANAPGQRAGQDRLRFAIDSRRRGRPPAERRALVVGSQPLGRQVG